MNPALNSQTYIAKGNAPWFSNDWSGIDKVISTIKSDSGTTVTYDDNITDMAYMFRDCSDLTALDLSNFDTSNVVDMGFMFSDCHSLTSLDLSNFDTSNVEYMNRMFACSGLTKLDLSNFDTSNVFNMGEMFSGCYNLTTLDLSNFNTSNVFNMSWMFSGCSKLTALDLSSFDTSNVENMLNMFWGCNSLTTIKGVINMKSCRDFCNMFADCPKLRDVKIKNPPSEFEKFSGISKSQYTVVS